MEHLINYVELGFFIPQEWLESKDGCIMLAPKVSDKNDQWSVTLSLEQMPFGLKDRWLESLGQKEKKRKEKDYF